jgi:peroxiredoxin
LAQLSQDYDDFVRQNIEIIALGPDGPNAFRKYWEKEGLPFIGLADIKSKVASLYHQEVNWLKAGRMPAVLVIDLDGRIASIHYGESMSDIPSNREVLEILKKLP